MRRYEDNIKTDLLGRDFTVWSTFTWLRTGTGDDDNTISDLIKGRKFPDLYD
jgi:hypothetical protein